MFQQRTGIPNTPLSKRKMRPSFLKKFYLRLQVGESLPGFTLTVRWISSKSGSSTKQLHFHKLCFVLVLWDISTTFSTELTVRLQVPCHSLAINLNYIAAICGSIPEFSTRAASYGLLVWIKITHMIPGTVKPCPSGQLGHFGKLNFKINKSCFRIWST